VLDNIADGFLGLFMFLTQWLSPHSSDGEIRIAAVRELTAVTAVECVISIEWNDRMSDLLDAGIPVSFAIMSYSDKGDTVRSIRTLSCDVADYTYMISDSLLNGADSVYTSKKIPQIFRAVKLYQRFERTFSRDASILHVEAVLLPSRVNRLNRSIDLSEICDCRKFSLHLVRKGTEIRQ